MEFTSTSEQQHSAQQTLMQAQDDLTRLLRSLSMAEMAAYDCATN